MEFELTNDGVYRIVTLKADDSHINEDTGGLIIGAREYTVEELIEIISGNQNYVALNIGIYDIDDTLSICNLKKCLAELELK